MYNESYDINLLHVFGCLCCTSTITSNRKKLDPRALPCVFLGFKPHKKGYITFNLKTRAIEISRNVVFYEDYFPYFDDSSVTTDLHLLSHPPFIYHDNSPAPLQPPTSVHSESESSISHFASVESDVSTHDTSSSVENQPQLRRSDRPKSRPKRFFDFQTKFASTMTSHSSGIRNPPSSVLSYDKLSPSYQILRLYSS